MAKFINCNGVFSRSVIMKVKQIAKARNLDIRIAEDINGRYGVQVLSNMGRRIELFSTFEEFANLYL